MGGGRGPCSSKEKEDPVSDFEGEFSGLGGGAGEAHGSHGGERRGVDREERRRERVEGDLRRVREGEVLGVGG